MTDYTDAQIIAMIETPTAPLYSLLKKLIAKGVLEQWEAISIVRAQ